MPFEKSTLNCAHARYKAESPNVMGIERDARGCSGVRIACHSSSDLVLLASDIFRVIANLDGMVQVRA